MNKILNWTIGSFFRTIGRIIAFIVLGLLLGVILQRLNINIFQILDVSALETNSWIEDIQHVSSGTFYNWTSSSNYNTLSSYIDTINYPYSITGTTTTYKEISTIRTNAYVTPGDNGISLGVNTGQYLYHNYLYIITLYICTTGSLYRYSTNNMVVGNAPDNSMDYSAVQYYDVGLSPASTYFSPNDNKCYSFSGVVQPSVSGSNVWVRVTSGTSQVIRVYGYKIETLGSLNYATTSQVQSIVENSGFASASSVSQVQSSVNQVKQELSSVNSSIENQTQQQHADSQAQIDNANQNTEDIINNQNSNTQSQIDSQKVCSFIDKSNVVENAFLDRYGNVVSDNNWGITDYISVSNSAELKILTTRNGTASFCFYDTNKTIISCIYQGSYNENDIITIPETTSYMRFNIHISTNKPSYSLCKNGNQATNDKLDNMNDTLNNSDTSEATSSAGDFFSNFTTNQHGLTGIITAPLSAIQSLTSKTCSPLVLPLPFVNQNLELPCMRSIYDEHFGAFMQIYDVITLGIISYWVMVRIFGLVKDFKNPEHDEIEVVDL